MTTPVDQAIVELDRVPQGSIRLQSATPPVISIEIIVHHVESLR